MHFEYSSNFLVHQEARHNLTIHHDLTEKQEIFRFDGGSKRGALICSDIKEYSEYLYTLDAKEVKFFDHLAQ